MQSGCAGSSGTRAGVAVAALTLAALTTTPVPAQPARTWVFFSDRAHLTADAQAFSRAAARLDPRTLARRAARGVAGAPLVGEHDLDVAAEYVAAIEATGAQIYRPSRWLNAVSVVATPAQLERIRTLPFVRGTTPVARAAYRGAGPEPGVVVAAPEPPRGRDLYGHTAAHLAQIDLPGLHAAGFTGVGVVIGVLDTGFKRTHVAFNAPGRPLRVRAEYDFVDNDANAGPEPGDPWGAAAHGTRVLSLLAGYAPYEFVGAAFDAEYILCRTEDPYAEYPGEEDNFVAALEFVEAHGGDVVSSSLGYIDWYSQEQLDGRTAVTTRAVNLATALGLHVCTAAGNGGHDADPATSRLVAPADAFHAVACGAVTADGTTATFSSDGPTADGRVKPEVLAGGHRVVTASPWDDFGYNAASGTSFATPLIAGAVACIVQAHPDWPPARLRTALMLSASDWLATGRPDPLQIRGYGIIAARAAATDCNVNGLPDVYEVRTGAATDGDGDGQPDECQVGLGDLDCDGAVDFDDVAAFVLALTNPAAYQAAHPDCQPARADCNGDGVVNFDDIDAFVARLAG